jgi:hypothetical protein
VKETDTHTNVQPSSNPSNLLYSLFHTWQLVQPVQQSIGGCVDQVPWSGRTCRKGSEEGKEGMRTEGVGRKDRGRKDG